MRALITGGAGFVGLHLARRLVERGDSVLLVDRPADRSSDRDLAAVLANPAAELLELDLLASDAPARVAAAFDPTHLFHLAALLGVDNVLRKPLQTLLENVSLLTAALEIAGDLPDLERFVFASTSEVYAGSLVHLDLPLPTPEDTPLALTDLGAPRTAYMLSKLYGEAMVRHAGLPSFAIVRPHNVYGPRMGMRHVVPQLLEKAWRAQAGGTLEVFSVEHRRSFCYVDDAAAMLAAVATAPAAHDQVLNLGAQGPEVSMGELARVLIEVVGKELTVSPLPAHPGSPTRRLPAMARLTDATGVTAQVALADGIARTWAWYREHVFEAMTP